MKLALFFLLFSAVLAQSVNGTKSTSIPNPPVNYGVVVYPGIAVLDMFGPLQLLDGISRTHDMNLALIAATMDPVSSRVTNKTEQTANSNFQQSVLPTYTFANAPEDLEVLLVPAGDQNTAPPPVGLDTIAFVKETYPKLRYIISVCTGATILARAGVLDGRRATTNKYIWKRAILQGPNVEWVPTARWVVDESIWTTSGVAAGMDGILGFIEHVYGTDLHEGSRTVSSTLGTRTRPGTRIRRSAMQRARELCFGSPTECQCFE